MTPSDIFDTSLSSLGWKKIPYISYQKETDTIYEFQFCTYIPHSYFLIVAKFAKKDYLSDYYWIIELLFLLCHHLWNFLAKFGYLKRKNTVPGSMHGPTNTYLLKYNLIRVKPLYFHKTTYVLHHIKLHNNLCCGALFVYYWFKRSDSFSLICTKVFYKMPEIGIF